jgi:hypothetical protein
MLSGQLPQWYHPLFLNFTKAIKLRELVRGTIHHIPLQKVQFKPEPKKRKVAETALASRSKAASASGSSQPVKVGKPYPSTQAVQKQTAKRIESFARFNQKAQLYQAAMERFRQSLVYYNRRFCENIKEADLVDLTGKSEEVKMTVAQKQKLKNCTASTRVLSSQKSQGQLWIRLWLRNQNVQLWSAIQQSPWIQMCG